MKAFPRSTPPLALALVMALAGCGKDNQSGKKSNGWNLFGSNVSIPGMNSSVSAALFQSVQCTPGTTNGSNQRVGVQIPLNFQLPPSQPYVGITLEGDLAFVTSSGGRAVMTAYVCARPGMTNSGTMATNPVLGSASIGGCPFNQITMASLRFPASTGYTYRLEFFPVHFSQYRYALGCR